MKKSPLPKLVLYQTIGYFSALIVLGLFTSALGPTLTILAQNTSSLLAQISLLFTARSFGYLLGSLLGGRLYDRLRGHPVMVAVLAGMAFLYFLVPNIPVLVILILIMLMIGVGEGTLDVGANALLVWVHKRQVGPYMNALHFFFGIGTFIGPVIIAQSLLYTNGITAAYWILGICALPVAFWLVRLPSPAAEVQVKTEVNDRSPGWLVGLIVLFFFLYVGAEVGFAGWISTYSITLELTTQTSAAYLTSLFWGSFTLGRLVGIPIATRFQARTILSADLAGCVISLLILLIWPTSPVALVIGTIGTGLSMASIFPTMLIWAERQMHISGKTAGYFFMGAGAGGMFVPLLIGLLFQRRGPGVTIWIILADTLFSVLVYMILVIYNRAFKRQLSAV